MNRSVIAAILAGFLMLFGAPAASAYTPDAPAGDTITAVPREAFTVSFTGFREGDVLFTLEGVNAEGADLAGVQTFIKPANAQGNVDVTVTLPANAEGRYTLTGEQDGVDAVAVAINVASSAPTGNEGTGASAGGGADDLPVTGGTHNSALVASAAALLVAGAIALVLSARRRSNVSPRD
ncbi:LPXTG cell wall anchor domain-containing protein [Demequina globuliformis]|uniref:LPXTG cell wall anchor domain-containing protein n=1 Tax=Demequina globuliformis TaxID=676202 RepID=UPI000784A8A3|nr:LPXTG cell wall anchor domain-containing protein [Demequina globuliformis]